MARTENRRDSIVEAAARLFMARGYAATSVREIAREVGVTEAALYYHFDGKRDLLREVIRTHLPDLTGALDHCRDANSLGDLVVRFGQSLGDPDPARMERFRWVTTEFPRLSEEERTILHEKHLALHRGLANIVLKFVGDEREAETLSWTIISAAFGYALVFWNLDLRSVSDFEAGDLAGTLGEAVAARQEHKTTRAKG